MKEKFVQISLRVEESKLKQIAQIGDHFGSTGQSGGIRYAINKTVQDFEMLANKNQNKKKIPIKKIDHDPEYVKAFKYVKPIATGLKQVTFRVDGGVYDELCKMAKEMGIGKSAIIRIAVSKLAKERSLSL